MRIGCIVALAALLAGVIAPLALANAHPYEPIYEHYLPKEEAHRLMEAVFHFKHHPDLVSKLDVEQTMWLLKGVKRMQQIPFADQDALFDLQLKLSLHLLDLQVKRLYAMTAYAHPRHPMPPMDMHGLDRGQPMDKPMEGHPMKAGMEQHREARDEGHPYPVVVIKPIIVIKKEHMPSFMVIRLDKEHFHSSAACHLSQERMTRQHAWDRNIFVGPCQQVADEVWTYNVWQI